MSCCHDDGDLRDNCYITPIRHRVTVTRGQRATLVMAGSVGPGRSPGEREESQIVQRPGIAIATGGGNKNMEK